MLIADVFYVTGPQTADFHVDDSHYGFAEDTSAHFGGSLFAIDKYNRDLHNGESEFPGFEFHLDLKTVPFHPDAVEVQGFEQFPRHADESGG